MQDQITKASGDKIFLKCVGELRDEDDRSINAVLLFKEKEKKNPENQCFVQTVWSRGKPQVSVTMDVL